MESENKKMPIRGNAKIAAIDLSYMGFRLAVDFGKCQEVFGFGTSPTRIAVLQAGQKNTLEVGSHDLMAASQPQSSSHTFKLKGIQIFATIMLTPEVRIICHGI